MICMGSTSCANRHHDKLTSLNWSQDNQWQGGCLQPEAGVCEEPVVSGPGTLLEETTAGVNAAIRGGLTDVGDGRQPDAQLAKVVRGFLSSDVYVIVSHLIACGEWDSLRALRSTCTTSRREVERQMTRLVFRGRHSFSEVSCLLMCTHDSVPAERGACMVKQLRLQYEIVLLCYGKASLS